MQFVKVKIPNKTCAGIYMETINNVVVTKVPKINEAYKLMLRIKVNGRTGKKIFHFTSKKSLPKAIDEVNDARLELRKHLEENKTLRKTKPSAPTSRKVKDLWDEYIETRNLRESTFRMYQSMMDTYLVPIHNMNIDDVGVDDIHTIIDKAKKQGHAKKGGVKEGTLIFLIATIRPFFKKMKHPLDFSDILDDIKLDNKRAYTLQIDDTKRIVKAMKSYHHTEVRGVFHFLLTGRRVGEVLNLKYENLTEDTFTIPKEYSKSKKEMVFNFDDDLKQVVAEQSTKSGRIFDISGRTIGYHLDKITESLKLPQMRVHDLRHMIGSTLYQNGVPIQDISRALGHSSVTTTINRYVNSSKEQAATAVTAFKGLMDD